MTAAPLDARLHIVTGKGGTGKTTAAAALALALAGGGRRVLLCEVEGRQGIASVFDVAPLPYGERRIAIGPEGGEIWALAIDAEAALLEYLDMFYHLGRAGKALDRFGVIDFATTVAPGVRDVLLIGKVYEAARRKAGGKSAKGRTTYDAVVLDAPPTGRIGRFLNVNTEVVGIAKMGPIRNQALSIMKLLKSDQSKVHFVTTLEEMPVQEALDGIDEMARIGLSVGAVVVNMQREPVLSPADLAEAAAGKLDLDQVSASLTKAGITADDRLLAGLADEAAGHADRILLEETERERIAETGVPVFTLPYLSEGVDLGALYDFADHLRADGRAEVARETADRRRASAQPGRGGRPRVGPMSAPLSEVPALDVESLVSDRSVHIIVCCGSGGVGKTTTSAALALRAAERGRKVVVLTIDPARRLAQSMGLTELDNIPRPVEGVDGTSGGTLDAMMLDMKRTFDEVVEAHATPEKAAQILANPFYQALSSSFAGTQEYMAMEKLSQLQSESAKSGRWDLIVVDTPPARSALDFLDAPERLSSFLDGRVIRVLLAPARGPARFLTAGMSMVTATISKVLGGQMLGDVQTFVAAFDTLFGGFRARAEETYQILKADQTAFLVVASPDADALREAAFFVERLGAESMPLAGLVLNRLTVAPPSGISTQTSLAGAERLIESDPLTAGLLQLHAERLGRVGRERTLRRRFAAAHPQVATVTVPALATDVHDLASLRRIATALTA